jgi:hypothetical protein
MMQVSESVANAVAHVCRSPVELIRKFEQEGPHALKTVKVRRGSGGGEGRHRSVGPKMSVLLYSLFMATDGAALVEN